MSATSGNGHGHTVTTEQILRWNADVIIVGADAGGNSATAQQSVDQLKSVPGFRNLSAVRNGRVYANPDGAFLWDFYGIEEARQKQWAAKLLYPKQFASQAHRRGRGGDPRRATTQVKQSDRTG